MKKDKLRQTGSTVIAAAISLALLPAPEAQAQLSGHNTLGDFGLMSGSQPAPGFYATGFYYRYGTSKVSNRNGERVSFSPEEPGEITVNALAGLLWYVSDVKILGANYGVVAVAQFANAALEASIFGLEQTTGVSLGDLYLQPINLGWHTNHADFTAGVGLFMPSGRYEQDGSDNVGLGMWSFELYAGTTVFFDEEKSWHLATTAFYETHTEKKDSDIEVGDILSLEGGFGKAFFEGAINVGIAYYAQWKITNDNFGIDLEHLAGPFIGKHKVFGVGPEFTVPIATTSKLISLVNVRLLWEFGARTKTQGMTLAVTATFPIPSIPLD